MLEINSMMKPVIIDQHGQLFIFEDKSELEVWVKSATDIQMNDAMDFECLNDLRSYMDRLKKSLSDIESIASDAQVR